MAVYVLDKHKKSLMPCSEKRARLLLERGRARIHLMYPFTIRLVDRLQEDCDLQPLELKLDPGSKVTGVAVVRVVESRASTTGEICKSVNVLSLMEIIHRGRQISEALTARRQMRRRRRSNLRYRAPRFNNRGNKSKGWIAPSLQHRVDTTVAWVKRIQRLAPITSIAQELVRFDMQKINNPDIQGVEYQQGTLLGYETREFLLEKWDRTCAYCGAKDVPLQIEHIHPKAKGGTNSISNLTLACTKCNTAKGILPIEVFLAKKPLVLKMIQAQTKRQLKDAAAVNTTRWALFNALKATGLTVTTGSGGLTKFNRVQRGLPKTHALDAVCVGIIGCVSGWQKPTLQIKCTGRGSYQRTRLNAFGFPRGYMMRKKSIHGFQTGDIVKAVVTNGKKQGCHRGRVAIRATANFDIQTKTGVIQGISHRHCTVVQRGDGYGYDQRKSPWDNLVVKKDAIGTPPKAIPLRGGFALDALHPSSTSTA